MTGHGRGTAEHGGRRVTVEVRAVNHRFLDLKLKSPLDPETERRAADAVRRRLERGSVAVAWREEGADARAVGVNFDLARSVHAALAGLARALGSTETVPLALVAGHPGVLSSGENTEVDPLFLQALDAALDALVAMRRAEGTALARDLGARLDRLAELAAEIGSLSAGAPGALAARLRERIERLDVDVPAERLAAEVALLAERMDVTEELVRLASHLEQARGMVLAEGAVGRKLDFLVQEIGREVNTIGAKAQSAEVSRRVVDVKAELEKIREQVQNVE